MLRAKSQKRRRMGVTPAGTGAPRRPTCPDLAPMPDIRISATGEFYQRIVSGASLSRLFRRDSCYNALSMIIVIGGGIIGVSIAYHLSQAKLGEITLIEKEALLGSGVTKLCSGGVRSQFETEINVKFSIESLKTLNALAGEIGFKKLGYLILDTANDSRPRITMQNRLGVASQYLTPEEIGKRFTFLNLKGVQSGSFYSEDGLADPASLLAFWEKKARQNGVKFLMETKVTEITKKQDKITGIKTAKGEMKADWVILAAGVQSRELGKTIGLDIPIVHRRKYVLVVQGFPFDFPLVMETPRGWYIKKEGEDALLGMSGKEEKVDFEKQNESTEETIEASLARVPALETHGIKKVLSSLSDETPDKHAIIDHSLPGLIIATGFSGHGFMHSPVTGQIVTALVAGEKPVLDPSELKLQRSHIKETIAI